MGIHQPAKAILVNARVLSVPSNGQRRVASELISRLQNITPIYPNEAFSSGIKGHAWEQFALPSLARGKPLWSPSTSGPVLHPNHIVTVHDIAFDDGPQWFSKSFATTYHIIVSSLTKSAKHIVTVSDFTKRRLVEKYRVNSEKITTIYSGKSSAFYPRTKEEVSKVLKTFNIFTDKYIVAFCGTDPRKNFARIEKAWRELNIAKTDATLVTFGRSSNSRVFRSVGYDDTLPSSIHLGVISDDELACLYTGCNGFLFPSLYEGFGLPIIEAEACGCPVATSNLSAMPEICSTEAILVDPYSIVDIKVAILRLLCNEENVGRRNIRLSSASKFDWDISTDKYNAVFAEAFD